jgi:hypothetical protein
VLQILPEDFDIEQDEERFGEYAARITFRARLLYSTGYRWDSGVEYDGVATYA